MRNVLTVALVVLCAASVYAADGPRLEVSGAFSSQSSGGCCLPMTGPVPVGWDASVAADIWKTLSVVGVVSGNYETVQVQYPDGASSSPDHTRAYAFLGGPRLASRATGGFSFFGQVLFGVTQRAWSVDSSNLPAAVSNHGVNGYFAFQPGGGVDMSVNRRWAVRFQADDRLTPMQGLLPARWAIS